MVVHVRHQTVPGEGLTRNAGRSRSWSLGEVKRRTKVIGRFPGETSCLTLVRAVLDLYITHATNGINFIELKRQRLKSIRYQPTDQPIPEEAAAA